MAADRESTAEANHGDARGDEQERSAPVGLLARVSVVDGRCHDERRERGKHGGLILSGHERLYRCRADERVHRRLVSEVREGSDSGRHAENEVAGGRV